MEFTGDIFALEPPANRKFSLIGATLPSSKDVYFRSKQKEIIEQYSAARIFMYNTENTDFDYWFNRVDHDDAQRYFELTFKGYFYEIALIYYNIVVDLSWTACYLAAEFALTQKGARVNFGGIQPIEDAYKLMRAAENLVSNPTAEENPFEYLKVMCPEFSTAIDMIIDFWKELAVAISDRGITSVSTKANLSTRSLHSFPALVSSASIKKPTMEIVSNLLLTRGMFDFSVA